MPPLSNLALGVLACGAITATVIDLRTRRIPNALTATLSGLGIAMAATGTNGIGPLGALVGFALGLLLMMPGYLLGATGAGDVKLMAAVGAIVGPALIVSAFLFTAVTGGLLAIAVAAKRGQVAATIEGTGRLVAKSRRARQEISAAPAARRFAYGPAIAIGSLLAAVVG